MNGRDSNYNGNLKKDRSLWSAVVRENFLEEIEVEEETLKSENNVTG